MNTKMLMLGILLIAGLSFAAEIVPNWMTYAVDRYGCSYYYNGEGWDGVGLRDVAAEHGGTDYWDLRAMDGYLRDMSWAIWDTGMDEMCYYSTCWNYGQDPSPTGFRQSMLEYNTAAFRYKSAFNQGVRNYLAEGGSRGAIVQSLMSARNDYLDCLSDIREEGPCYICMAG